MGILMVRAYHVIITAYGFWLPNDPRGSWSDFVGSWELRKFGEATKTETRRSVAGQRHDRDARLAAKAALKYSPVVFNGEQARAVGQGFAKSVVKSGITIWACAILPEHVHLVIARHQYRVEQLVNLLKGEATKELNRQQLHPLSRFANPGKRAPTPWAENEWKVYLDDERAIRRSVNYVEGNPEKENKSRQRWSCVTKFDGLNDG